MLNAEQERYIQNLRDSNPGLDEDILRSTLEEAEWPETDINEAFSIYYPVKNPHDNVQPPRRKTLIVGSVVVVLVIILSVIVLKSTTQESLVKDMTNVSDETLVQFEAKLDEVQQLYSGTLNSPEMLPILEKTKYLDFYPEILGKNRINDAELSIVKEKQRLEGLQEFSDSELDGMKLEMQKRFKTVIEEESKALITIKADIEKWKLETRKELEADLVLRKEKIEQRNPLIEQALLILRNEEPSLDTEVLAVEQGKQIQDTSSKFKYLLLKKLSKVAAAAAQPAYDYTEFILQYDPNTLNEESYYVFQAILAILDERYVRVAQEQDLHYIYKDEFPNTIADGLDDGLFKLGTNICSQEIVQALMVFADTVAENVGDSRRSICQESNETFAVFYPREYSGKVQYFCTGTGEDGKRVLPYATGRFQQDTTKSFCIERVL